MSTAGLKTAVMGATGYSGFELARLLLRHPKLAEPLFLRREGEESSVPLDEVYPHLSGNGSYPLKPFSWETLRSAGVGLLFMATPHELSRELIPEALSRGLRVIDLSGAWRLKCLQNRAVYGFTDSDPKRAAELDQSAVYGLPELHREEIAKAALVANPGCYPTLDHRCACAAGSRRPDRCGARHHLRFEIRCFRRRQEADIEDAFRGSCRQFFGVFAFRAPAHRRGPRTVERRCREFDFQPASASDSARHSVDDLCAAATKHDGL